LCVAQCLFSLYNHAAAAICERIVGCPSQRIRQFKLGNPIIDF